MKKILILIIFILFLNNIFPDDDQSYNVKLTVVVEGIEKMKGEISIGIYNSDDGWTESDKEYKGVYVEASREIVSYIFEEIPAGTYAIAVFHDLNMNKILDKNLFGIPKEGYGFSNNVFGIVGPPDYLDASFLLDKDMTIYIKLKN